MRVQVGARPALWVGVVLSLLVLTGCGKGGQSGGLTLAGSTSVEPFAELLAEEYMAQRPGSPPINVQGGGSSAGIQAAQAGVADIGMSSRELRPEEKGLRAIIIARDAIAIVVHPHNPLEDLSLAQIQDIFSRRVGNWRDLGGGDDVITVVTREEGSGTRGAFQKLVMGEVDIDPGAIVQDSNGAVRVIVAGDPNAIGYISLGIVNEEVKPIRVDGLVATPENARSGRYALVRPFLFLVREEPQGQARNFIEFVLSPPAQELLSSEGLVEAR